MAREVTHAATDPFRDGSGCTVEARPGTRHTYEGERHRTDPIVYVEA